MIGASILYHLSRMKIKAILVKKNRLASGSSGACDGLIFLPFKTSSSRIATLLKVSVYQDTNPMVFKSQ